MSAFDDLDAMMLETAGTLFGDTATIFPMSTGGGVNAKPGPDATRSPMAGIVVIRSEWSERVQIGGNGLPSPKGAFGAPAAGRRVNATVSLASLQWVPRQGDEIVFDDRPDTRYQIAEPMPDGLAGLHLGLTRISG